MESANSEIISCEPCNITYKTPSGLWKHNAKVHPEISSSAKSFNATLACGLCDELFIKQTDICKHVSESHSISAAIQQIEFDSIDEFDTWKKMQEAKSCE